MENISMLPAVLARATVGKSRYSIYQNGVADFSLVEMSDKDGFDTNFSTFKNALEFLMMNLISLSEDEVSLPEDAAPDTMYPFVSNSAFRVIAREDGYGGALGYTIREGEKSLELTYEEAAALHNFMSHEGVADDLFYALGDLYGSCEAKQLPRKVLADLTYEYEYSLRNPVAVREGMDAFLAGHEEMIGAAITPPKAPLEVGTLEVGYSVFTLYYRRFNDYYAVDSGGNLHFEGSRKYVLAELLRHILENVPVVPLNGPSIPGEAERRASLLKEMRELYQAYVAEMADEGSWSELCSASEGLANVVGRLRSIVERLSVGKDGLYGHSLSHLEASPLFKVSYKVLTDKALDTYCDDPAGRNTVVSALNNDFRTRLDAAFKDLSEIYHLLGGGRLEDE